MVTESVTVPIVTQEDLYKTLAVGTTKRHTARTDRNDRSSRGHTIFVLHFEQRNPDGSLVKGKLNIVDLAGSENVGKSDQSALTKCEGTQINLSLSHL